MADILSQEEIDSLLSALSSGEVSEEEAKQEKVLSKTKSVKTWDFRRPDRFSKDQTRTLQMLHEQFARVFSGLLSMHMRSLIEVKLVYVDQLTYDEFIRSLPNPTCLAILNMTPLEGQAMLEMSPAISFTFIDRMMGGHGTEYSKNRELTEIEQSLLGRVIAWVAESLTDSWKKVVDLEPEIITIETNPQMYLQHFLPGEMVILLTFDITAGKRSGTMGLCIPHAVVEPIMDRLSSKSWHSATRKTLSDEKKAALYHRVSTACLPVIAALGTSEVTAGDILDLRVGDIVSLNTRLRDEIPIYVENQKRFYGKPGTFSTNRGVKITQVIEEVDETEVAS